MLADAVIELGTRSNAERLFSYPNEGHERQSLEETIEHYLTDSLQREGISEFQVMAVPDTERYTIRITLVDPTVLSEIAVRYQAFFNIGKIGLQESDSFQSKGKWGEAWKFLLPLGVPITFAKAVEIMDFPPLTLINKQDYLNSKTTSRWWELLALNDVVDAEKARYSCILDIVPVAAPANDGENLTLSGIYDGPFDNYGLSLLELLASTQTLGIQRPLVALGRPIREWMKRIWNLSLNICETGIMLLRNGHSCSVIASNHPAFFYYAVHTYTDTSDAVIKNLAVGLAVMKQDIVVAAWHAQMGRSPNSDPAAALQASTLKWRNRDPELLEIVKEQAGIVIPREFMIRHLAEIQEQAPDSDQLLELERRFYAEGKPEYGPNS